MLGFRWLRAAILCFLPAKWARLIVSRMGYDIARSARIGFSWIDVDRLEMSDRSLIGHLNLLRGHFEVCLSISGKIGNMNMIERPSHLDDPNDSRLSIGEAAGMTSRHFVDMTASIDIGDFSALAGRGSQLWTRPFGQRDTRTEQRADGGPISIGRNVYVGSMCQISGGAMIADGAIVGGATPVSHHLGEAKLYVTMPLKYVARSDHGEPDSSTGARPSGTEDL